MISGEKISIEFDNIVTRIDIFIESQSNVFFNRKNWKDTNKNKLRNLESSNLNNNLDDKILVLLRNFCVF